MPPNDKEYYSLGEVQMLLVNEGYTRYAINRAIDRLKLLGQINVEIDPLDERARRVRHQDLERIRQYLKTGQ
jgi:DNA-binding MarR family transcriptional regulator